MPARVGVRLGRPPRAASASATTSSKTWKIPILTVWGTGTANGRGDAGGAFAASFMYIKSG
jgi:hypothetical protein